MRRKSKRLEKTRSAAQKSLPGPNSDKLLAPLSDLETFSAEIEEHAEKCQSYAQQKDLGLMQLNP